ncbi:MAG TPA: S9 family peptidase [Acidimicrobiia bacterium]|nr:S9 family peptidase [Acidimicrobiia bacterium]
MAVTPYGAWESPISALSVTRAEILFADSLELDGGTLYWAESRPNEEGRTVIVRRGADGSPEDVTPAGFNARTRVHEYGCGAYALHDGVVYFANFTDQRLYRHRPGEAPAPITPEPPLPAGDRYADLAFGDGLLICVRERHGEGEAINELVRLPLDGGAAEVVAGGHDFFSSPRLSPDGRLLAWLAWDHPNMPWNGTGLWLAELGPGGRPGEPRLVAGGPSESIFQPEWSPEGVLHFASDRRGWWNLYRLQAGEAQPVAAVAGDAGGPQWVFRLRRYAFLDDGSIAAIYTAPSGTSLVIHGADGTTRALPAPGTWLSSLIAEGGDLYMVAGSPTAPYAVVRVDAVTGDTEIVRAPDGPGLDPRYTSVPERATFPTPDGAAHLYYYPPTNPEFAAPAGDLPPLLVAIHGGPTSAARPVLDPEVQFWTSRGFAVADVDYGGSTGYGRAYWERLHERWGIVDVRDCALAAAHLAGTGRADPARLAIRGGSAGGYTTLAALAFRDEFAAGASHYGVADLELLARDTHKFESRYLDWLVGPYPQARATYRERSPIYHAEGIDRPVILFQGLEDRVVPPEQAGIMAAALRQRGVPVAHLTFPGEGHGFRKAENIARALEAELSFYGQVFGFTPAGDIEPVVVEGL